MFQNSEHKTMKNNKSLPAGNPWKNASKFTVQTLLLFIKGPKMYGIGYEKSLDTRLWLIQQWIS